MTAEPDRDARTTGQTTTRRSVILFLKDFFKSSGLAQHHGTYTDQALSHLHEADAGGFGRAVLRHGCH